MTGSFKERFKSFVSNDFFVAAVLLIVYLCTNSYIFGWDDQHLEIPLLKHLIDPALYKGDYYVESLAKNFSSYFYPILSKFITTSQVPTAYFILFIVCRYLIFLSLYKLWKLISKDRFAAFCAVLMFILLGRTEEFLYRTFSHQTVGECFMFAGIYFFYKERFLLAAFIFGLAANIHGLYNLFPMLFMLTFLLFFHPKRWSMVFKTGLIFTVACIPFLMWQLPRSIHEKLSGPPIPVDQWMPLYLESCPQNFLFNGVHLDVALKDPTFILQRLEPYLFLLIIYIFLLVVHSNFRRDLKTHAVVWMGFCLIMFSHIFTMVIPNRFVLDLNLLRNEQFIRLFLMAYITFWAVATVKKGKPWQALLAALMFLFVGFGNWLIFVPKFKAYIPVMIAMAVIFIVLNFKRLAILDPYLRRALIIIPLLWAFCSWAKFHYDFLQVKHKGQGFWQFQRNWEDMQRYVRDNTPKNAMILAPIDTDIGGFRIQSERRVVVCIRDCGIIGFDYAATVEWKKRMADMKGFIVMTKDSVDPAILNAVLKYKVDYIVFMKYYEPRKDNPIFKKVYDNEVLSLFKVMVHP